jgi:hypothetical protein
LRQCPCDRVTRLYQRLRSIDSGRRLRQPQADLSKSLHEGACVRSSELVPFAESITFLENVQCARGVTLPEAALAKQSHRMQNAELVLDRRELLNGPLHLLLGQIERPDMQQRLSKTVPAPALHVRIAGFLADTDGLATLLDRTCEVPA